MFVGLFIICFFMFKCVEGVVFLLRILWLYSFRLFVLVDVLNEGKRKLNEDEGYRVIVEGGDVFFLKEDMDDYDGGGLDINIEIGEVGGFYGLEFIRYGDWEKGGCCYDF